MKRLLSISMLCATLLLAATAVAGTVVFENQCSAPIAGSVRNQLGDALFQFYLSPGQVIRFSGQHDDSHKAMSDLPWTISAVATEQFAAGASGTSLIRSPEDSAVTITCPKELVIKVKQVPTPGPSSLPAQNATQPVQSN